MIVDQFMRVRSFLGVRAHGVPDQGVDRFLSNPEIRTRRIQTCPAVRRVPLLPSALAFHFTPGCHRVIDLHTFQMYSPAAVRTVFRGFRVPLDWQMVFDPLPPPFHSTLVQPPPQARQVHQQQWQSQVFEAKKVRHRRLSVWDMARKTRSLPTRARLFKPLDLDLELSYTPRGCTLDTVSFSPSVNRLTAATSSTNSQINSTIRKNISPSTSGLHTTQNPASLSHLRGFPSRSVSHLEGGFLA